MSATSPGGSPGQSVPQPANSRPVDIPKDALDRLGQLGEREGGIFTSDLSVAEFLLVEEAGFYPLGLVLGTSIYHVGMQRGRWSKNQELTVLSQAMYHARELAMGRMVAEATQLGADGIVGVRLEAEHKAFGEDLLEFIAVGTAIKARGERAKQRWRDNRDRPFSSDLSGQDFWTLLESGHAPLGMVMGTCVYHVAHRSIGSVMNTAGRNAELPEFTQALYDARELAMERMQAEAVALDAEGIVGVQLRQHSHMWGGHTTEFFAVGTAVRPFTSGHVIREPQLVLPLDH